MTTATEGRTLSKIVHPGRVTVWTSTGRETLGDVFCKIEYRDERLSITGVEAPRPNGNCWGSCGQIAMGYKHRDDADDDGRYSSPTRIKEWAPGWTEALWFDFLDVWKRWHMNDVRSACKHQRALGWKYDTHRDPDPEAPGYPYAGLSCPECGYRIGSAWLHEDVPADVLDFLDALPDTDKTPAWV